jgi:hypothetical protein
LSHKFFLGVELKSADSYNVPTIQCAKKKKTTLQAITWMLYSTRFLQLGFKHGYDKACYTNITSETVTYTEQLLLNYYILMKCEDVTLNCSAYIL